MLKKSQTMNPNIKRTQPLFIKCTKGKGVKFSPLFIHHDTIPDELRYSVELLYRDEDGQGQSLNGENKFYIPQDKIESLFDFITATTELRTKEAVSIMDLPAEQSNIIKQLLESGYLKTLIESGQMSAHDFKHLRDTLRISEIEKAIMELETLLASSDIEKDYEDWCSANSWVFGNYYVETEDVHQISNAERVDLLINNAINQYRDIIEFKKPSFSILAYDNVHQNYYFSKEVSKAISQVLNYSDIFSCVANNGLHRHTKIVAYYPKSIIVIGRSDKFDESQVRALHGLNSRLNGIVVKSYDDLLNQAKNLLRTITMPADKSGEDEETIDWDGDDIPF